LESHDAELKQQSEDRAASMAALGLTSKQLNIVLKEGSIRLQETMETYS
jgi:hypothetical protein